MEECPGSRACHGCLKWCDLCGDVGHVCDDPRCDQHKRAEDMERQMALLEEDMKKAAEKVRADEIRLERGIPSDHWNLRADAEWYGKLEDEMRELEEEAERVRRAGSLLVPRPEKPRPSDPRQLLLFTE